MASAAAPAPAGTGPSAPKLTSSQLASFKNSITAVVKSAISAGVTKDEVMIEVNGGIADVTSINPMLLSSAIVGSASRSIFGSTKPTAPAPDAWKGALKKAIRTDIILATHASVSASEIFKAVEDGIKQGVAPVVPAPPPFVPVPVAAAAPLVLASGAGAGAGATGPLIVVTPPEPERDRIINRLARLNQILTDARAVAEPRPPVVTDRIARLENVIAQGEAARDAWITLVGQPPSAPQADAQRLSTIFDMADYALDTAEAALPNVNRVPMRGGARKSRRRHRNRRAKTNRRR